METVNWLARCADGEESAVEEFAAQFSLPLYRLALAVLKDPVEASEVAQDALVKAWLSIRTFNGQSSLNTWIYAIALNECRASLRRRRNKDRFNRILVSLRLIEEPDQSNLESIVLKDERDRAIWRAVNDLEDQLRIPVILRYYQQIKVCEIARILEIPEGTVHSRLNTARARLQSLLQCMDVFSGNNHQGGPDGQSGRST